MNGYGTRVARIVAAQSGAARLMIVRAGSSSGAFTDLNEATAIRYAVDHGARILDLSLGGPRTSPVERDATRPEYPAALLGADGAHAQFSNAGPWLSLAAPGSDVTSFAAPVAAAAAALVRAASPRPRARQVVALLEQTASGRRVRTDELGYGVVDVQAALA
jgi:subtilisin family serine protease